MNVRLTVKPMPIGWNEFPFFDSPSLHTKHGTPYLVSAGVALISKPQTNVANLSEFLGGYDATLNFPQYVEDPTPLPDGAQVCKIAGQVCYASYSPKRTMNADAERYFDNIRKSGHGSVLEHANYSFILYGTSRSMTHEIVRHRAGMAYSQLSQRYVSGSVLRFVERPEYQNDPELHALFEKRIDGFAADYEAMATALMARQKEGSQILSADAKTDLRKKVQQAARSILPNETEAPLVMTGNVRAWRHFIEMRASPHAETEIRAMAFRVYLCLVSSEPLLFGDYRVVTLDDGTNALETDTPKV